MERDAVSHFEIYADDPEKLAKFYSDLFSWEIQAMPEISYWWIKTIETNEHGRPSKPGGINGGMLKRPEGYKGKAWINYVNVDELEPAMEKTQQLGGSVMKGKTAVPGMGWYAMLTDTEGNIFALWKADSEAK